MAMKLRPPPRRGAGRVAGAAVLAQMPNPGGGGELDLADQLLGHALEAEALGAGRLAHIVDRPQLEGADSGVGAGLGEAGNHHHRRRPQGHDLFQERQAVHLRHLDVEGDDVGTDGLDDLARFEGIGGGADDLDPIVPGQRRGQHLAHQIAVVDNHHSDRAAHFTSLRTSISSEHQSSPNSSTSPSIGL